MYPWLLISDNLLKRSSLLLPGEEIITRKYPGETATMLWEPPDSLDRDRLLLVNFYFNYQGLGSPAFLEVIKGSGNSWNDNIRDDAFTDRVSSVGIPDQAEFGFQIQDLRLDTDHTGAGTYRCQYQEGLIDDPVLDPLDQVLFIYGKDN